MDQFAFEEAIKAHLKQAGLSQAAVARKLNYTPEQFNKWVRGVNRIPDVAIQEFSDLLGLTDKERTELFTLAGYVAVTALKKETEPVSFGRRFFIDALKDWNNNFFRWSEASEHMRSSWAGRVILIMSAVTDRITPRGFLIASLSLLLGIVTTQLVMPALQWPLDNAADRWLAYLKYGLATWLVPLLVTLVTPPDRPGLFQLETTKQRMVFWLLKFTGALVGFWVFSLIVMGVAMGWYYLSWPSLTGIWIGLALVPLFFSYIAARRIPMDRYKMFDGELRLHPADWLFLAVFTFLGPFMALFCYFSYWFLSDRRLAPPTLILLFSVIALWEHRKQDRQFISDPVLILILGLFIPFPILLYGFLFTPDLPPPSSAEFPLIIIFSIYCLSWTLLLATLLVRQPPTLTLTGVFSLLALVILAILVLAANRWLGVGFGCMVILTWVLWGRKRFQQYFWVHASLWAMVVATGIGTYLLISKAIPIWANGLSFTIIFVVLISWAYRGSNQKGGFNFS